MAEIKNDLHLARIYCSFSHTTASTPTYEKAFSHKLPVAIPTCPWTSLTDKRWKGILVKLKHFQEGGLNEYRYFQFPQSQEHENKTHGGQDWRREASWYFSARPTPHSPRHQLGLCCCAKNTDQKQLGRKGLIRLSSSMSQSSQGRSSTKEPAGRN